MDFKDLIRQIADKIENLKEKIQTEEATKTALIMPFIAALGYDIFNPAEVVPEMTCDIGVKKWEKVDYAVMKDNTPIILIECKHWKQDLNIHDNQLIRYFNVSKAKFGILTNGIEYRFYTDLAEKNIMDRKPFMVVNLLEIKDSQIEELKKFHKSYFNVDAILSSANELKYMNELRIAVAEEFNAPTWNFVKHFGQKVYSGKFYSQTIEQFTPLVKRAINDHINEVISSRLKSAMETEKQEVLQEEKSDSREPVENEYTSRLNTTSEELEAYYIVKSIIRSVIDYNRITYRDAISYFSVFIDDNRLKPICRLYLESESNMKIGLMDENRKEHIQKINKIDEIYQYSSELIETAKKYI